MDTKEIFEIVNSFPGISDFDGGLRELAERYYNEENIINKSPKELCIGVVFKVLHDIRLENFRKKIEREQLKSQLLNEFSDFLAVSLSHIHNKQT